MPNYSLTINSKFNPLSFSDMVQPYLMYKEEYEKQQNAISDLNEKASVWENLANKETDQRTYNQYKAYSNSLKAQANSMARWGLSPGTRSALVDLKSRYSSDIAPIQTAYDRRQKLAEEQRKGRAAGLIYDYDAATTSLDNFVFGNQKDYDSIDLNKTFNMSAQTYGNIAKELENYGKGKSVDAYTNTFIQQHGITKEQAAKFAEGKRQGNLDNDDPVMQALDSVFNSIYNSTNVANWNNPTADAQVRNTILAGAEFAIGQTNVNTIENYGARLQAQEASQLRTNNAKGGQNPNESLPAINPSPIYSTALKDPEKRKYQLNAIKQYKEKGWLSNDGNLTVKGIKEYNKKVKDYSPSAGGGFYSIPNRRTDFYKFLNNLGMDIKTLNDAGPNKYNMAGDAVRNYINYLSNDDSNIHRQVEIKSQLSTSDTDQSFIKHNIVLALGKNQKLQEVDYSYKDSKFIPTGNTIDSEEFLNNYKVISTNNSAFGRTIIAQDEHGNNVRLEMPSGINWLNEQNSAAAYTHANSLLNSNDPDARDLYIDALQKAAFFDSQLWYYNNTKNQVWNPIGY